MFRLISYCLLTQIFEITSKPSKPAKICFIRMQIEGIKNDKQSFFLFCSLESNQSGSKTINQFCRKRNFGTICKHQRVHVNSFVSYSLFIDAKKKNGSTLGRSKKEKRPIDKLFFFIDFVRRCFDWLWFFNKSRMDTNETNVSTGSTSLAGSCSGERYWFAFLFSSLATFFVGVIAILLWRCGALICKRAPMMGYYSNRSIHSRGRKDQSFSFDSMNERSWATIVKEYAAKLISGQKTPGKILVSCPDRS